MCTSSCVRVSSIWRLLPGWFWHSTIAPTGWNPPERVISHGAHIIFSGGTAQPERRRCLSINTTDGPGWVALSRIRTSEVNADSQAKDMSVNTRTRRETRTVIHQFGLPFFAANVLLVLEATLTFVRSDANTSQYSSLFEPPLKCGRVARVRGCGRRGAAFHRRTFVVDKP